MKWHRVELALSWIAILSFFVATEVAIFSLDPFWMIMGFWALCVLLLPVVITRNVRSVLPFELLILIAIPFILYVTGVFEGWVQDPSLHNLLRAIQVASTFLIALITVMNIHIYTSFKTNTPFLVVFTVMLTMALGSIFAIAEFLTDELFGTHFLVSNEELMVNLLFTCLGGVAMGLFLALYLRKMPLERLERYSIRRVGEDR